MLLGLERGAVRLSPHSEEWHTIFESERQLILGSIGALVLAVEHIGSTAICGIMAKPIIDICVAVEEFDDGDLCVDALERLGYAHKGENGIPHRKYFVKGDPRTHHLHLVTSESNFWHTHLLFRDYLNEHPSKAAQYDALKKELALRFSKDREAYTFGKAAFINEVLIEAGA